MIPWQAYSRLTRMDKPIGTFLLLWPTLWAVWIAGYGHPSLKIFGIFVAGILIMRAAGCAINDVADRHLDGHVQRTQYRPLATGELSLKQALALIVILCLVAFILVLQLNLATILLACLALALSSLYPFMKRFTHWPQPMLGIAWYMGLLMAFTAQRNALPLVAWLLYLAVILWTVAYDTLYAMVDRPYDVKVGIKSTAILFGRWDRFWIAVLQGMVMLLLIAVGFLIQGRWPYYLALLIAATLFLYQQKLIRKRSPIACFQAFQNNHWVGLTIFLGIFCHYALLF